MTGTNIAQQFITLGLLDEISIHFVTVLFGSGIRLFEHLDTGHIPLETVEVIETKKAIHLRLDYLLKALSAGIRCDCPSKPFPKAY